jgi:hypothetical protein
MKVNIKENLVDVHDKKAVEQGVGSNVLWNGPFNTGSLPKGQGSSSGITGIILNNDKPLYNGMPITQKAKPKF